MTERIYKRIQMNKAKDECIKINSYHIGQHTGVAAFLLQIYIQSTDDFFFTISLTVTFIIIENVNSFWYVSIGMTVFNSWE